MTTKPQPPDTPEGDVQVCRLCGTIKGKGHTSDCPVINQPSENGLNELRTQEAILSDLLACGCPEGSPPCIKSVTHRSAVSRLILVALQMGFTLGATRGPDGEITEDEVGLITMGIEP